MEDPPQYQKSQYPQQFQEAQSPPPHVFAPPQHTIQTIHQIPSPTIQYGPKQQQVTCSHCNTRILTKTTSKATSKTHLIALCLCLCLCLPCVCIPYCMDSCMNINHYCPNCKAFLGTYQS